MFRVREHHERGSTSIGWLKSWHTFSFGDYVDRKHMNYLSLRVINDDIVAAGKGFDTHGHRDMEIITVVLKGQLEHKDSMGHGEVLRPGEVQVMSAGRGVRHSEFNPSPREKAHFLQIWITPSQSGLDPAYAQKAFPREARLNRIQRVAGRDGVESDGALKINQDADVMQVALTPGGRVTHVIRPNRGVWVHVATGSVTLHVGAKSVVLRAGDGGAVEDEAQIEFEGSDQKADVLLFDMAETAG